MNALLEPHHSAHNLMSLDTLRATVDFFCREQEEIEFIWHGGEPLLAGKRFFEHVVMFQKPWRDKGRRIVNFVQTNGTAVTWEWATFLAENGLTVGVSLDAPPAVHDALRLTARGKPTHEEVLRGISFLKEKGIFNGVSCCIGRRNVTSAEEVVHYFLNQGIKSIKFLRIKDADKNSPWFGESISAEEYVDFLLAVFEVWLCLDDPDLEIRDLRSVVDILLGGSFRECTYLGCCDQFVTVYSDGSIYACDSFLNYDAVRFGTVFESLQSLVSRDNVQAFQNRMAENKSHCRECQWSHVCRGGCMYDAITLNPMARETVCQANKKLFTIIQSRLMDFGLL